MVGKSSTITPGTRAPEDVLTGSERNFAMFMDQLPSGRWAPWTSTSGGSGRAAARSVSPQEAMPYTLSLPIATLVSGIDTMRILRQYLAVAQGFRPMTPRQRQMLLKRVAPAARDCR